ncbi:BTAD domain-containing putative transcriptional regulator [Kitasatospora sp. NPDC059827]|uniref:AfsR/SARP family transcriptional regulator n=1 Tax=Kitasatospora sp. NPDC059827 TaxID=3346964 RepID=UPI003658CE28
MLEIAFLGPTVIRLNGESILPSAGKPRQLLTLLALRADRAVQVPTLMAEIWDESIPRSAATTLQTYILQLRRRIAQALGEGEERAAGSAKDVLATRFGSYQLTCPVESSDLREFDRLAARGRDAMERCDPRTASAELASALVLWRGPAFADVTVGRSLEMETLRLEEAFLQVQALRIEADLQLGRHSELIGELRMLTAQHPMDEGFCAQFMTALYRSGGAWRALEAYQRLRRTLDAELGVEPSPRLQRLHLAVLRNEPLRDAPGVGVVPMRRAG